MKDTKLKVVFAIHSLCPGGQERVASVLMTEFAEFSNVEIHLVLFGKTHEIFYTLPDNVIIHKPEFTFNNNRRFLYTFKTMVFIRKVLKNINANAILSFGEHWNSLVLLSVFGLNLPVFVSDRNQPGKKISLYQELLRKILYKTAKGIVAQTHTAAEILYTKTKHKNISIIGNPIPELNIPENNVREKIVLSVGRLIDSKHHDELIKLFVKVRKEDWRLIIVGDDAIKQNNKSRLEKLVRGLDAEQFIELTGKCNHVNDYYLKSDIFAFTSSSEGFPNVIGEAMMAGLPVVAFDCVAGPSEMIQNDVNGFLIPLFNYSEFENKLSLLMENENMRINMGESAKHTIQEFNSKSISLKFFNFMLQK